jgi:hypothetical protein
MSEMRALTNTISFIEEHLCTAFDLEDLGAIHGYSRSHFPGCFIV